MHQLEKTEGGLTSIEERVLRELAVGAGAREVVIYLGSKINTNGDSFESVKSRVSAT
jgi:rod shape-determining protein MreB and related proteins